MEEETSRRSIWKTHMHVGGRSLLGREGKIGGIIVGNRRVAHEEGQEEAGERTMETKQFGPERHNSVAQERGRSRDGRRETQMGNRVDGQRFLG